MTNEKILKKAIEKAVKNGFDKVWLERIKKESVEWRLARNIPFNIIFSHDFVKALLGIKLNPLHRNSENYKGCSVCYRENKRWQNFLQQMVLEEKPLKYLEKFL